MVIQGILTEAGIGVAGVGVEINVLGTVLPATTDALGNYLVSFPLPVDSAPAVVTVSVSAAGASVSAVGSFTIATALNVAITPDRDYYQLGDVVYCTIMVTDAVGLPVSSSDLTLKATYLGSGGRVDFTGSSDVFGENVWSFIWGEDGGGNPVREGKIKAEVTAGKAGYSEGTATVILSGCGDLVCGVEDDCLVCSEDCACGPGEECDPSSDYREASTMCSPKVACMFISNGLNWYEKWWAADDIKGVRKKYQSLGCQVTPDIAVNDIYDVAKYLLRPSTRALAYAGHAGGSWIENIDSTSLPNMINICNHQPGGFIYRCRYETHADRWLELQDKIRALAQAKMDFPELDYAFMFSCHSLDDYSLRDYFLKSGGTYWGHVGPLSGSATLTASQKP